MKARTMPPCALMVPGDHHEEASWLVGVLPSQSTVK
jgi:hypothetical protein